MGGMDTLLVATVTLAVSFTDKPPAPEDVTAGWGAFVLFMLLIAAVVFLSFSLVKQLRKAQAAKDAGVYDEPAEKPQSPPV
jgi:hypothetical protein